MAEIVVVIRRCMWCKRYLTPVGWADDAEIGEDEHLAAGICPECLNIHAESC